MIRHKQLILILALLAAPLVVHGQLDLFNATPVERNVDDFTIDLVWEAQTFVPGGYAGKALPANGSVVTVTALTPGRNPAALTFMWEAEDSFLGSQGPEKSGVGENTFSFITNPISANFVHRITVTALQEQTGQRATQSVAIPLQRPHTLFMPLHQGGTIPRTVESVRVQPGQTLSLLLRPFFFNIRTAEELETSWTLGSERAPSSGDDAVFTLTVHPSSGAATRLLEAITTHIDTSLRVSENARILIQP